MIENIRRANSQQYDPNLTSEVEKNIRDLTAAGRHRYGYLRLW